LIDLPAEPGDLAVQLVDDAVRALLLLLDVGDFVGEGMGLVRSRSSSCSTSDRSRLMLSKRR